jgi:hypothetical protein
LLQQDGIVRSLLQLDISELLEKGYLEQISVPDDSSGRYFREGHRISEKGRGALELFRSQAGHFVSKILEAVEKGEKDYLYKTLEENKDLLRFAYYKRLITKSQIEKMAKQLRISPERIWWGDSQGELSGGGAGVFPS